jgi:ATP phosphoribosyltransferase regulatory subunit
VNAPAIPSGVLALMGDAVLRQREAEQRCLDVLLAEGFQLVLLPVLEYEQDQPGAGYRFVDRSGQVVALRTDFTPLAARMLAPTLDALALPLSVCYSGEVVRPQPHRLRQLPELYQLGFERYGVSAGAAASLALTLRLARLAGVDVAGCHVTVSVAGLAERIVARISGEAPDRELVEMMRVHDLDGLREATGLGGATLAALEAALFDGGDGGWAETLGVQDELAALAPVLEAATGAGVPASVEVAPRLAGDYYRGAVFSLWGRRTRAVIAGGGDYVVALGRGAVSATGACLSLGITLEESANPGTGHRAPGSERPLPPNTEDGRGPEPGPRSPGGGGGGC